MSSTDIHHMLNSATRLRHVSYGPSVRCYQTRAQPLCSVLHCSTNRAYASTRHKRGIDPNLSLPWLFAWPSALPPPLSLLPLDRDLSPPARDPLNPAERGQVSSLSSHARAMRCPVLIKRMLLPGGHRSGGLEPRFAPLSAYARAMRCPVLTCGMTVSAYAVRSTDRVLSAYARDMRCSVPT
eukprot:1108939-Rhodomonas_salina.1